LCSLVTLLFKHFTTFLYHYCTNAIDDAFEFSQFEEDKLVLNGPYDLEQEIELIWVLQNIVQKSKSSLITYGDLNSG